MRKNIFTSVIKFHTEFEDLMCDQLPGYHGNHPESPRFFEVGSIVRRLFVGVFCGSLASRSDEWRSGIDKFFNTDCSYIIIYLHFLFRSLLVVWLNIIHTIEMRSLYTSIIYIGHSNLFGRCFWIDPFYLGQWCRECRDAAEMVVISCCHLQTRAYNS